MRAAGVEFTVVKNTLMYLASEAAQRPQVKDIVQGPTAVALGYDDPLDVAKAVSDYIRNARSALTIQGAVLGDGPVMQAPEVVRLASLPPKPELLSTLLGQLQAPLSRLAEVLNGPLQNFDGLIQARIRQLEASGEGIVAEAGGSSDSVDSSATDESPDAATANETTDSGDSNEDMGSNELSDTNDSDENRQSSNTSE
jgi:large subunit ribosomal protein L10